MPDATQRAWMRQAMDDWQKAANGFITFVPSTSATKRYRILYKSDAGGSGNVPSYNGCSGVCDGWFREEDAYHELGHAISPGFHQHNRNDRRHYLKINKCTSATICGDLAHNSRCEVAGADVYGPFNYKSSMLYPATYADFTRWDGSVLCLGGDCTDGACEPNRRTDPPECPGGIRCPTCTACQSKQPFGYPTRGDGSAVVEWYLGGGWGKFRRTVEEASGAGASLPWNYDLAPGVTITKWQSPAVETWESGTLSIYVRGSNNRIYQKTKNPSTGKWSGWLDLLGPGGSGATSDPAAVSWGWGRTDLVTTRDSTVYIKSYVGGWGSWTSLGAPPSPAASSPAITSWTTNRLDVFVRGADNQLYWKTCTANCNGSTGAWSGWGSLGASFKGKPAVVSRAPGIIDVFVHGNDNKLWGLKNVNDVWSNWFMVAIPTGGTLKLDANCPDCSSPAAGSRGSNMLDVFVRGLDDQMWVTSWGGGSTWTAYSAVGGVLSSSPATVSRMRSTSRIDTAVIMPEETTVVMGAPVFKYGAWWKEYNP